MDTMHPERPNTAENHQNEAIKLAESFFENHVWDTKKYEQVLAKLQNGSLSPEMEQRLELAAASIEALAGKRRVAGHWKGALDTVALISAIGALASLPAGAPAYAATLMFVTVFAAVMSHRTEKTRNRADEEHDRRHAEQPEF